MPRITKVYTRTGDDGSTALTSGRRVPKDSLRVETYGTIDELSSHLGVARSIGLSELCEARMRRIQNQLFHLGAEVSYPPEEREGRDFPGIEQRHVDELESLADQLMAELDPLENFVLPGGARVGAELHVARTVCRRAERCLVSLARDETVSPESVSYLNRLSDLLFVMARYENHKAGSRDLLWDSRDDEPLES